MKTILETERLILRNFDVADAPFMLELVNHPTWLKYIGDRKVYTLEDAERYLLQGSIASYQENGFGFYLVLLKDHLTPIGTCGMAKRPFLEAPDFGFAFLPEYTGLGYAYEVASANLAYAKNKLQISELLAITVPENQRSIHLLEKLGFRFEKIFLEADEEVCLYRLA